MKIKMKYRSHRYDINRPRHRNKHKYTKYNIQSIMMVICIKQHLSNIWNQFMKKLSNTQAELEKSVAYKRKPVNEQIIFFK